MLSKEFLCSQISKSAKIRKQVSGRKHICFYLHSIFQEILSLLYSYKGTPRRIQYVPSVSAYFSLDPKCICNSGTRLTLTQQGVGQYLWIKYIYQNYHQTHVDVTYRDRGLMWLKHCSSCFFLRNINKIPLYRKGPFILFQARLKGT